MVMPPTVLLIIVFAVSDLAAPVTPPGIPVQKRIIEGGEFDYVAVPTTLAELVTRSPAIVRVRITAATERSYQITGAPSIPVRTDVTAEVLGVLKSDAHTLLPGQAIHVLHPRVSVGVDVGNAIIRHKGFPSFEIGSELLLFLEWNAAFNAYDIGWGPTSAYLITSGRVAPFDMHSAIGRAWNGRSAVEMLSAIGQALLP